MAQTETKAADNTTSSDDIDSDGWVTPDASVEISTMSGMEMMDEEEEGNKASGQGTSSGISSGLRLENVSNSWHACMRGHMHMHFNMATVANYTHPNIAS